MGENKKEKDGRKRPWFKNPVAAEEK